MSDRKSMTVYWAILALPDRVLPGRRPTLLGKMFLLDHKIRGCYASAEKLGRYVGLSERTVQKYRLEFVKLGLVSHVPDTNVWHVTLPEVLLPDGDSDAKTFAYMKQLVAAIKRQKSTPTGVPQVRPQAYSEYAHGRTQTGGESTPTGVHFVLNDAPPSPPGLGLTKKTRSDASHTDAQRHDASRRSDPLEGLSQQRASHVVDERYQRRLAETRARLNHVFTAAKLEAECVG